MPRTVQTPRMPTGQPYAAGLSAGVSARVSTGFAVRLSSAWRWLDAVLLVKARNHGRSDHEGQSSLPRFAEDLDSAIDWLAAQPGVAAGALVALGHSVGAAAALLSASRRIWHGRGTTHATLMKCDDTHDAFDDAHDVMRQILSFWGQWCECGFERLACELLLNR